MTKFTLLIAHSRPVTQVKFNLDGDLLFSSGKDKKACVFRASDGFRIHDFGGEGNSEPGHKGVVNSIDVTHDSKYLITGSADMSIAFWEVATGRLLKTHDVKGPCRYLALNNLRGQQNKLAIVRKNFMSNSEAVIIYDVDWNTLEIKPVMTLTEDMSELLQVHFGAFDETIITTHATGHFRVWDAKTGEKLWEEHAHKNGEVGNASFNEDRLLMLTVGADGKANLWDMVNREKVYVYETDRCLNAGALHPHLQTEKVDGKLNVRRQHLVIGGGQKADQVTTMGGGGNFESLIFHAVNNELLMSVKGHFSPINALAWLPDGSGFVSGAEEGNCRIHRFEDKDAYWTFEN